MSVFAIPLKTHMQAEFISLCFQRVYVCQTSKTIWLNHTALASTLFTFLFFPFGFMLHRRPLKIGFSILVTLAGVVEVFFFFVSNDEALRLLSWLSSRNLGQRERAYVEGQMRTLDEGLRLKQQLIEEGVLLWREKQVICWSNKTCAVVGKRGWASSRFSLFIHKNLNIVSILFAWYRIKSILL